MSCGKKGCRHVLGFGRITRQPYLTSHHRSAVEGAAADGKERVEKSVTAQKSLLSLLANTVTKSGDATIARFAASAEQPQESRDYANDILTTTKRMQSAAILGASLSSYDALKQEQRKLFARVSDEALGEWDHLQIKIRRRGPR